MKGKTTNLNPQQRVESQFENLAALKGVVEE